MSEMGNRYFTTGEFAKLCGTTKETLFHYDKVGILKPKKLLENGYRVYSSDQFFELDLIRVLKQAGSSLQEIEWYLNHYDAEHFIQILKEKKEQIRKQRDALLKMENMLEHTVRLTERALAEEYGVPRLEYQEEETLLVVRLEPGEGDSVYGITARLGEHFKRCESRGLADKFPLGSIILKEEVLLGGEEESYFFSRMPEKRKGDHQMVKPAGTYATVFHKGNYDTFTEAYQGLLAFIRREGLEVAGNAYVYELISYLAAGTQDSFVMQISVQVVGAHS